MSVSYTHLGRMASDLGISRKELQKGKFRLPAYRALYLDHLMKESPGVAYYRDQMLKAMVPVSYTHLVQGAVSRKPELPLLQVFPADPKV